MEEKKTSERATVFPILFGDKVIVITSREKELIDSYLETGDIAVAAKQSGLTLNYAKKFLHSERLLEYFKRKTWEMAVKNEITLEKVLTRIYQIGFGVIEGKAAYLRVQLKALEDLAQYLGILKPQQTNIAVVQNQQPLQLESPYKSMTDEQINLLIQEKVESHIQNGVEQTGQGTVT